MSNRTTAGRCRPRTGRVCIPSERPVTLKGIGSILPGIRIREDRVCLRRPPRRLKGIDADCRAVGSVPPPRLRISSDGGDLLKPVEPEPIRQSIPWELLARARRSNSSHMCIQSGIYRRRSARTVAWAEAGRSSRAWCVRSGRVFPRSQRLVRERVMFVDTCPCACGG
jgi:hypothetical protein